MTYITLLKNQLRFSVTTAVCVFLLSACGSNSTPPVATDRLAFNAAVVAFDITTDPVTLTAAELAFTNFIAAYPTSSLVDDAYYYIARSVHERAKLAQVAVNPTPSAVTLFTEARSRYSDTTTIPPTSNRADNAQLQIGKTYYDQTTLANNYGLALTQFTFVLTNFPTSSIADDAQYYIGRTKHAQALLAQIAVSPDPIAVTALFTAARDAYGLVISNYTTSTRRDDAQYQIGRTYYDLTIPDYPRAITEFNLVFQYTAPSVGDDARYYLGRSKHEIALLPAIPPAPAPAYSLADARTEYNLVLSNYCTVGVPSARCDDAQYQVGKTHYDVAIPAATDYSTALGHFQTVLSTYGTTASASDNAQYYIGRTMHGQALLLNPTSTLALARDEYLKVNAITYPGSVRLDDAQYQVGRTYFDVATPTATDYSTALGHFQDVISTYTTAASAADDAQFYIGRTLHEQALLAIPTSTFPDARTAYLNVSTTYPSSIRLDDAAFYSAMTFHDAEDCPNEKTAMTAFVANFSEAVSPIFNPDAQRHLDGVTYGGGGHNTTC
ncbi:MAG: hypothetical protein ABL858_08860 [Candidatus Nitrotoga sp.]